jgi:hypothetical protein
VIDVVDEEFFAKWAYSLEDTQRKQAPGGDYGTHFARGTDRLLPTSIIPVTVASAHDDRPARLF